MSFPLLARIALSFLCVTQGVATVAIDFNRTHASHPPWPGHARFHLVWQGSTMVLLATVENWLIWYPAPWQSEAFYLAALLAAVSPLGFLAALLARRLFGGTLADPNGIKPARLRLFGAERILDINLVAVLLALVCLGILCGLHTR